MTAITFGSPEATAIHKKDRVLRAEAERQEKIEEAKREGHTSQFEVYIEPSPPPERSVVVTAFSEEEAWDIAERNHLEYGEIISGVVKK